MFYSPYVCAFSKNDYMVCTSLLKSCMYISMLSKCCKYTYIKNYLGFITNAQRLITRRYHKTKYAFHPYDTARYDDMCYVKMSRKRFCMAFAFSPWGVQSATLPHSSHHEQTYYIYKTCLLGFQRYILWQGVSLREVWKMTRIRFLSQNFPRMMARILA